MIIEIDEIQEVRYQTEKHDHEKIIITYDWWLILQKEL